MYDATEKIRRICSTATNGYKEAQPHYSIEAVNLLRSHPKSFEILRCIYYMSYGSPIDEYIRAAIENRAYALFEQGGRQHGKDVEHWLLAETFLHRVLDNNFSIVVNMIVKKLDVSLSDVTQIVRAALTGNVSGILSIAEICRDYGRELILTRIAETIDRYLISHVSTSKQYGKSDLSY